MKLAPVGMFCVQVDFFALNLALPRTAVDLNETTTNMQWVISAYLIAVGAAMIPGGRLGDLRGHRRIVVAGLAVFGGASLICALSFSYGLLIGFRALQGLGAAALFTISVAAISNAVASDHRAVAIGALFGIANIGAALGPFIGGLLTEQLSWRWVFFLNVPLSAIAIFCCLRWLPSMPPAATKVRIDWLGLISRIVKDGGVVELAERAERVVVLTRQGCHLCDEVIAQVAAVCADTGERYATVDVDSDPELQRRYTDQVPVTFVDGAQHDFWRVDPVRLKAALLRSR